MDRHRHPNPDLQECYAFTLRLSGFDELTEEIENCLFTAGCDDALLGIHAGSPYLSFDREADSLEEAIHSAIKDVQSCEPPIEVVRVIPVGEETIKAVNANLQIRRRLHEKFKASLPKEAMHKIDEILDAMLNADDPAAIKQLLK